MDSSHLYDRGILFASLDELVECELGVLVTVHVAENFVHPLFATSDQCGVLWRGGVMEDVPSQGCPRPEEV